MKNGSGAERLRIFIVLILRGQSNRVIMLSWIRREAEDLPFLIPKVSRRGVAHYGVCRIRPAGLFLRLVGAGGELTLVAVCLCQKRLLPLNGI